MRIRAAVATILAAAAILRAGEEGEGGAELLYEFQPDEASAAAKVLEKRLELLGVEGATVKPVEGGRRVVVRLAGRDRLEDVRAAAERVGRLEVRGAVRPGTSEFLSRRLALQAALRRGDDVEQAREIPAGSLSEAERARSPGGFRWYRNPSPAVPPEDWILCEIDARGITEEAFEEIRVVAVGDMHEVHVRVKPASQEKMADLTSRDYTRVAIIVDGEIVAAPLVRRQIRDRGTIRTKGEREARAIAAALGGGVLPSKPTFVAERRVGR
jgi:preprotein translocase subunit SecD